MKCKTGSNVFGGGDNLSTNGEKVNGQTTILHNVPPTPPTSLHYPLNPNEMAVVKSLIAGYRESAAFLLRSADELEHLLLKQT